MLGSCFLLAIGKTYADKNGNKHVAVAETKDSLSQGRKRGQAGGWRESPGGVHMLQSPDIKHDIYAARQFTVTSE